MTGMETEENAFDAFAVPEPIDDLGDGMVDHDAGVDDMDRSEWSERAVGHVAEGGLVLICAFLIYKLFSPRYQTRVHCSSPHDHRRHVVRPNHRPLRV